MLVRDTGIEPAPAEGTVGMLLTYFDLKKSAR